jgi:nucleoside-diphosphate-sugar epimerase
VVLLKTLVTGGAGFIGSAIAKHLVAEGADVRVVDNLSTGFIENVPKGAEFLQVDLRNLDDARRACEDVEVVFHQGAIRSVPRSVDDPFLSNESNVSGTLNVLAAAGDAGVRRVIYASSSSVYGDREGEVNKEYMVPDPRSPYAVSKLAGEYYCRAWTHLGRVSTVSLRYFNVFGPGQHPESKYAAVFPAFISALLSDKAPEVHWDGEQSRDFSYIDDVVSANVLAAQADSRVDGAIFNIGGGHPKTVHEVLKSVSDAVGKWIDPVYTEKRPGDVRHTRADISRANELLGWEPRADWDDSVRATVRWFQ